MNMEDILRPINCKFCGGIAEVTHRVGGWTVDCKNADPFDSLGSGIFCGKGYDRHGDLFRTPNHAIIDWNWENAVRRSNENISPA